MSFQKDRYSTQDWVRFTVSLALAAKDEWAMVASPTSHPGGASAPVGYHARLGNQMPPRGEDRWWEIGVDPLIKPTGPRPPPALSVGRWLPQS